MPDTRPPICPECRAGKPWNCTGWAIDTDDQIITCPGPEVP